MVSSVLIAFVCTRLRFARFAFRFVCRLHTARTRCRYYALRGCRLVDYTAVTRGYTHFTLRSSGLVLLPTVHHHCHRILVTCHNSTYHHTTCYRSPACGSTLPGPSSQLIFCRLGCAHALPRAVARGLHARFGWLLPPARSCGCLVAVCGSVHAHGLPHGYARLLRYGYAILLRSFTICYTHLHTIYIYIPVITVTHLQLHCYVTLRYIYVVVTHTHLRFVVTFTFTHLLHLFTIVTLLLLIGDYGGVMMMMVVMMMIDDDDEIIIMNQ